MRMRGIRYITIVTAMLAAATLQPAPPVHAAEATPAPKPHQSGPLKPGRSAGVRAAQLPRTGLALVGASAIIAVVVVAASTGGSGNGPQANTQSMPTTTTP
jgi:hypothetical protein